MRGERQAGPMVQTIFEWRKTMVRQGKPRARPLFLGQSGKTGGLIYSILFGYFGEANSITIFVRTSTPFEKEASEMRSLSPCIR